MRAWQVVKAGEPEEALRLVEAPAPQPAPGLLRLRVAAAALGLPDVLMCRGTYPMTPALPFTPGQECVGEVLAVGDGAGARVGERVMGVAAFFAGSGAFAEEALAVDAFALPAPSDMDDAEAAAFVIPYHTAWVGLVRRAALRAGETLLVLGGSGGSGSAAIQLGRALGARVLATARGRARAAFCRSLGAEVGIDREADDVAEAVRAATAGRGVDVIYDPVGGAALESVLPTVAHEGRVLTVGFASGRWPELSARDITVRSYSVIGVYPGSYDAAFTRNVHAELLALHRRGAIRSPVGRVAPFDELPALLTDLAAGNVLGKAVLRVAPEGAPGAP